MSAPAHTPRSVLVTGGAGFIGCNFVRHLLESDAAVRVVNLDALTYAGHPASLRGVAERWGDRYTFVHGDIRDPSTVWALFAKHAIDTVVHFAAESHVDRSIDAPLDFIDTNVRGTAVLLEAARAVWTGRTDVRFHHVSTDEVFGSLGERRAVQRGHAHTTRRARTRPPRPRPTTWCAPGTAPTACRSRCRTAPTTTVPSSFRRS